MRVSVKQSEHVTIGFIKVTVRKGIKYQVIKVKNNKALLHIDYNLYSWLPLSKLCL